MTWHDAPYKGGPMISLPGFPRPLYPPNASTKGKTPSVNGPDVEAYKRVVWRLGRWPGPASGFDRAYSNAFAHGKSGNAAETGLAGVQRQGKLDDTGWIGENTFNLLRSAKVPSGIPHGPAKAGEYGMDAYAQSLLVDAWDEFRGQEPPLPPETSLRERALARAVTQLGVKEAPAGSNQTPYTKWYGMVGPWCAMFCTWSYEQEGDSPAFKQGSSYAYVPYIVSDARAGRNGLAVTSSPLPGDLVAYDWYYDGTFDHVGLFERWKGNSGEFTACEGNTSTGSDSDGGQVMRRTRKTSAQSTVFVRVKEP